MVDVSSSSAAWVPLALPPWSVVAVDVTSGACSSVRSPVASLVCSVVSRVGFVVSFGFCSLPALICPSMFSLYSVIARLVEEMGSQLHEQLHVHWHGHAHSHGHSQFAQAQPQSLQSQPQPHPHQQPQLPQ